MIEIIRTGMQATVQDRGRRGFGYLGVPEAGAMDPISLALSNRLVGNPDDAAAVEFLLGNFEVRFRCQRAFAVSGAPVGLRLNGKPVPFAQWHLAKTGDVLVADSATYGLRSYLAVAGGIAVEPVLGSRSTDTLSGLGPNPLRPGDMLPIGTPDREGPFVPAGVSTVSRPAAEIYVGFRWGPRDDRFTQQARETLTRSVWSISHEVDRIAARLLGPPLQFACTDELPTEGLALGSIQVPPSGQPILHLANHPPTGGYPVIGVVARDDVTVIAQCGQGTRIRFHPLASTRQTA